MIARRAALAAVVAVACQRSAPATDAIGTPSPSASSPSASAIPDASTAPPRAAIGITNVFPGTIAIENTGDAPVKLAVTPTIERADSSGVWTKTEGLDLEGLPNKGLRLVESCADTPGTCVTIAPHATFHPVGWSGMSCSSQCNGTCRANAFLGGRYRWVVRLCDGGEVAGPPFELPPELAELGRFGVTEDLVRATVMRTESVPPKWDGTAAATPSTVGGLPIRAGTERPVDPADLATLVTLLRTPKNFDDQIEKRCLMQTFVGVRLVRRPASTIPTHEETADLFVDFTCMSLFIVRGGEGPKPRVVYATHYDPSRAAVVAWAKKVLPTDAEIAKLK